MKRPRRPVKKARKVAPKRAAKRKGLTSQIELMTAAEAAVFDLPKSPPGFAYQWHAVTAIEHMLSEGWQQVPYSRHKDLPRSTNFDGYIVYRGNALFQISAAVVQKGLSATRLTSKDMEDAFYRQYGIDDHGGGRHRVVMQILSPSFMVSSDYQQVPANAPPIVVPVTLGVTIPASWQDAAAALKLDPAEYARRRIVLAGKQIRPSTDGTFTPVEEEEN